MRDQDDLAYFESKPISEESMIRDLGSTSQQVVPEQLVLGDLVSNSCGKDRIICDMEKEGELAEGTFAALQHHNLLAQ